MARRIMMTPKQQNIYSIVKRFGKTHGITPKDVGFIDGRPKNKSEKWAKPALRELIKLKLIRREDDKYWPIIASDI